MTDKLADALKPCPFCGCGAYIEESSGYVTCDKCLASVQDVKSWNTRHEAAKAATPDDVRDAVQAFKNVMSKATFDPVLSVYDRNNNLVAHMSQAQCQTLINAALRQGVTLPREVVDALNGIKPLLDVDCPDMPDGDSVGWKGDKEIPVTFGQVRRVLALLDQHARGG